MLQLITQQAMSANERPGSHLAAIKDKDMERTKHARGWNLK